MYESTNQTGCGALRCDAVPRGTASQRNASGVNEPMLITVLTTQIKDGMQKIITEANEQSKELTKTCRKYR